MNIIKKFGFNKETPKSKNTKNKIISKNKINIIPFNNNIKNINPTNKNSNHNNIKNITLLSQKNYNYHQLSSNNNHNYSINNNNIIIKKNTFVNNNKKPQKIINIDKRRVINKEYKNKIKINNESRADDYNQNGDKRIIIINNNINSFNNPNQKIIDKNNNNNNRIQNNVRKNNFTNMKFMSPIISNNSKMIRTDNYMNSSRNRINKNNMINRIKANNNNNNKIFNYIPTFNKGYHDPRFKNDNIISDSNDNNIISMPKNLIFNKSNDDIINKRAIKKIRIFNYKSIINRDKLQSSNNSIKTRSYIMENIYKDNSFESKRKIDMKNLSRSPISDQSQIKKKISKLINPTTNYLFERNLIPTHQFLSMENKSINPKYLNNPQNYENINYGNNMHNILSENNTNKLLESKSNYNILERKLNPKRKKIANYYDGNISDDYRSYEKYRKNNDFYNNLYKQKFGYSTNQYNNLYNYN